MIKLLENIAQLKKAQEKNSFMTLNLHSSLGNSVATISSRLESQPL